MNSIIQRAVPNFPNHMNQVKSTYSSIDVPDRTHYVLWSGGTDSTLLLYELLDAYGSSNVVAITMVYPWLLENKVLSERAHREAFKSMMNLKDPKFKGFNHIELVTTQQHMGNSFVNTSQNRGLPQALAWLLSVPIYAKEGGYIYDGGIRNDDLTLRLEGYHRMFEGMSQVMEKEVYLRQPYLYLTKTQVIERLINYGLYDVTWYCEMPDNVNRPCLNCTPCRTHMSALIEISSPLYKTSEAIKLKAKKELQKLEELLDKNNNNVCCEQLESKCVVDDMKQA